MSIRKITRAQIFADFDALPADLSQNEQEERKMEIVANRRAEAEAILAALNTTRWNRKHAAMLLNVDYKALLYKMKKLNLDRNRPVDDEVDLGAETEAAPPVVRAHGADLGVSVTPY